MSLRQLRKTLHLRDAHCRQLLVDLGVKIRSFEESMRIQAADPPLTEEVLRDLWVQQGFTQEGIGKMLGVRQNTVSKYARKFGLYRKTYAEYR